MSTEENQNGSAPAQSAGDGENKAQEEAVKLTKAEYEELLSHKATAGSLKRQLKDFQKSQEESQKNQENSSKNQPESLGLLQKTYLRAAGITAEDEVELAISTAKKWGMDVDALVDDEDFKAKLDKLRVTKANEQATSNIKGGTGGSSEAKSTADYWLKRGEMPTEGALNRKELAKFAREKVKSEKPGFKFYNDK